jgi:phosphatidate cytidylyltransferase
MTRLLSAVVLLIVVVGTIWFLPPLATLALAAVAAVLAFVEFAHLAAALGAQVPRVFGSAAVGSCCVAVGSGAAGLEVALLTTLIVLGALAVAGAQPGPQVLRDAAAALWAVVYIGMPLGALAAIRLLDGREAVLLLMAAIVVSDSAQYYCGRAFGRRLLAPTVSPKKTVEGAIGGCLFGTAAMTAGGAYVFPAVPPAIMILISAAVVLLGIAGDLFESLLKRSAGVKDSSTLIPGHGGVLDRIDSWLFAGPLYYIFTRYLQG